MGDTDTLKWDFYWEHDDRQTQMGKIKGHRQRLGPTVFDCVYLCIHWQNSSFKHVLVEIVFIPCVF